MLDRIKGGLNENPTGPKAGAGFSGVLGGQTVGPARPGNVTRTACGGRADEESGSSGVGRFLDRRIAGPDQLNDPDFDPASAQFLLRVIVNPPADPVDWDRTFGTARPGSKRVPRRRSRGVR